MIFFLPSITDALPNLSVTMRTFVTMLPYVCGFFGILLNGHLANRAADRRWFVAVPIFLTALALASAVCATGHTALVVACFCVAGFAAQAYLPAFWTLPSSLLTKSGAAVAIGLINSVGNLAGFVSPSIIGWMKDVTQSTDAGMYVVSAALIVGALLALLQPRSLVNR